MIKTCPICNRTYSDETISFCLADGALLSAPRDQSGPPTEVLPASLAPTQRATQPTPMPTIATPPPKPPRVTRADSAAPANSGARRLLLAFAGLALIALLLAVGYKILTRKLGQEEAVAANPNSVNGVLTTPSDSPREITKPSVAPSTSPMPANRDREKPTPTPLSKSSDKSGVAPPTPLVVESPKAPTIDYSKVFSGNEVDQRAAILSRPQPEYTQEARVNQISGVVTLRVVLSASGQVTNITVVKGLGYGLSEKAIDAARKIRFEPARKDGRAVSMYMQIQYNFNLY
jgi:TonB family protein